MHCSVPHLSEVVYLRHAKLTHRNNQKHINYLQLTLITESSSSSRRNPTTGLYLLSLGTWGAWGNMYIQTHLQTCMVSKHCQGSTQVNGSADHKDCRTPSLSLAALKISIRSFSNQIQHPNLSLTDCTFQISFTFKYCTSPWKISIFNNEHFQQQPSWCQQNQPDVQVIPKIRSMSWKV